MLYLHLAHSLSQPFVLTSVWSHLCCNYFFHASGVQGFVVPKAKGIKVDFSSCDLKTKHFWILPFQYRTGNPLDTMRRVSSFISAAGGLLVVTSLCSLCNKMCPVLLALLCRWYPCICRTAGPEGGASKHNFMHEYIHETTPGGISSSCICYFLKCQSSSSKLGGS